jgi:hypothetical protein
MIPGVELLCGVSLFRAQLLEVPPTFHSRLVSAL